MGSVLKVSAVVALIGLSFFLFAGTCSPTDPDGTATLVVGVSGDGAVTLNPPGGTYDLGAQVTLTANPGQGSTFERWEGDLTGNTNPATLTMDGDKQVTAVFVPGPNLSGKGLLIGQVSSIDGAPIPAVAVTLQNGMSASTDDYGFWSFSLPEGHAETIVAHFVKGGFAPTSKALTVQPAEIAKPVPVHMAPADQTVTIDSTQDNTVRTAESAVTIPAASLVDASGQPVTGNVELTVTHFDPSTEEVLAFPGSFGVAQAADGRQVALESFGFANYQLSQDGQPVNLAPGASATIEFILPPNGQVTYQVGDTIPLWEFDRETATWKHAGEGEVRLASDGSGQLAWFAEVPHFSDWNCDEEQNRHCITGQVVMNAPDLVDDLLFPLVPEYKPVVGATVIATGITYNGTDSAVTDLNGRFCVYAKKGSVVSVEIRVNGSPTPNLYRIQGVAEPFTKHIVYVPDSEAQCGEGNCVDMGQVEIPLDSAVKGRLTDVDGFPASGVKVHLSAGPSVLTDANGEFCARAPAGTQVYVCAEGWSGTVVTTPDSATCDDGNAATAELSIPLPAPGDVLGTLQACKSIMYYDSGGAISTMPLFSLSGRFLLRDSNSNQSFSIPGGTMSFEDLGTCSVTVFDYSFTWSQDNMPVVVMPGVHALDPGNPGIADNGAAQVQLVRYDEMDPSAIWRSGYFDPPHGTDLLSLGFDAGQTIGFQFPGGADIGSFDASIVVPADLVVTSPNLSDSNATISLSGPLNLAWVAGNPADTVEATIMGGTSVSTDNDDGTTTTTSHTVIVTCTFPDAGSGTVPAGLVSRIPAAAPQVTLTAQRMRQIQVDVPLKRAGGTGKVNVTGSAGVNRGFAVGG